jgi:hypothetical protein
MIHSTIDYDAIGEWEFFLHSAIDNTGLCLCLVFQLNFGKGVVFDIVCRDFVLLD